MAEISVADRIARWRKQEGGREDEGFVELLCAAEDRLRELGDGISIVSAAILVGDDAIGTPEQLAERMARRRCCGTCDGNGYVLDPPGND